MKRCILKFCLLILFLQAMLNNTMGQDGYTGPFGTIFIPTKAAIPSGSLGYFGGYRLNDNSRFFGIGEIQIVVPFKTFHTQILNSSSGGYQNTTTFELKSYAITTLINFKSNLGFFIGKHKDCGPAISFGADYYSALNKWHVPEYDHILFESPENVDGSLSSDAGFVAKVALNYFKLKTERRGFWSFIEVDVPFNYFTKDDSNDSDLKIPVCINLGFRYVFFTSDPVVNHRYSIDEVKK
jgi:hypothetical protein